MEYFVHIMIFVCLYTILGLSFNILVGYAGLLSLAQAAFYGVGAYITALVALVFGLHFSLAILLGVLGAMVISLGLAIPTLRVRGEYLVIASFGFQILIYNVFLNWTSVTGGVIGLRNIPPPILLGNPIDSTYEHFLLMFCSSAILLWAGSRILNSPYGLILKGMREDETAALLLGKNIFKVKVSAFIISAGFAGFAGSLFAYYITFIDPTSFTLEETIFILTVVIVGGAGSVRGSVIGAIVLVTFPELFKFLPVPPSVGGTFRQVLYGGLIIGFMMFRPEGIFKERSSWSKRKERLDAED